HTGAHTPNAGHHTLHRHRRRVRNLLRPRREREGKPADLMSQLEELLAVWLPRQRWFSGKGIAIRSIRVESRHTLLSAGPDGPELNLLVVEAGQRGQTSRYQVLLGSRQIGRAACRDSAETSG